MGLRIVVTVKQVPDTHNISGQAMNPDGTVNRAALPAIFNPEDLNALEGALQIKGVQGGSVTALTMGPPRAVEVLKECLFRGADDAVLLSDRRFAGSDTLATSYALACAVRRLGDVQIVCCGRQAIDGDTAQVGPQMAEKLGINQITNISKVIAVTDSAITLQRTTESGHQIVRSGYPVLLTFTPEANEPRTAAAKRLLAFKNVAVQKTEDYDEAYIHSGETPAIPVREWDADAIKAEAQSCGLAGSPTKVKQIESVVLAASQARRVDPTQEGINALMSELVKEHILG